MTDKLPPLPTALIESLPWAMQDHVEQWMTDYARQAVREAVPEGFTEDQVSWAAIRAGIGNVVCGRLIDELKLIAAAKEAK